MTCANCSKPALYEYKLTLNKSVFYCGKHLPAFLDARKRAGLLTLTETHSKEKASAINALTVEPVVEEVIEEPKPKKKAAKKKAE